VPRSAAPISQPVSHHRGPDFKPVYERTLRAPARSLPDRTRRAALRAARTVRWSPRSRTSALRASSARRLRRPLRRALSARSRRPMARSEDTRIRVGEIRPQRSRRLYRSSAAPRRSSLHSETSTASSAISRRSRALSTTTERSAVSTRLEPRAVPLETRRLGRHVVVSGSRSADDPAGAWRGLRLGASMGRRGESPRYYSTGADAKRPVHADARSRRRSRSSRGSMSRSESCSTGPRGRLRPAHPTRARLREARRRWGSSSSRPTMIARRS